MKNILPKVSIITPSYNQGQFIEATIQSILNQTYPNIKYMVVDSGSTDQTMSVVNQYKSRLDILIHEKDKGKSDAISKRFKLAMDELVGWLSKWGIPFFILYIGLIHYSFCQLTKYYKLNTLFAIPFTFISFFIEVFLVFSPFYVLIFISLMRNRHYKINFTYLLIKYYISIERLVTSSLNFISTN